MIRIEAQPGPQYRFLSSPADIVIYGGGAGGGKTYGLLIEPVRHVHNPQFGCVIFRRTTQQIRVEGGLWDTSQEIYPGIGGAPYSHSLTWKFPSGAKISMAHLEHDKTRFGWQGAQIPLILFDELTHFSALQFWYLTGRNRSQSGIKGYIRATTNPDPDSWVRRFISWWIDEETGFPIPERDGVIRWFIRVRDEFQWGDTPEELKEKFGADSEPKSLTFIRSTVFDNKILLATDPSYLATLKALPWIERQQLLDGNWNVRPTAGSYFKREWFEIVDAPPADAQIRVRYWDRAATKKTQSNDPDATAGVKMSKASNGLYYIEDVRHMFEGPLAVESAMISCASQDGKDCVVAFMQDPGSAGVTEAQATARALEGYNVHYATATGDKETRAKPVSAQAEAKNIKLVRGPWNERFLQELENFPVGGHDDQVDGLSGAFERIINGRVVLVA